MTNNDPINKTMLSGCVRDCRNNDPDYLTFLRKVLAEHTKKPHILEEETAGRFIAKYERQIHGASRNSILEYNELAPLFKILAQELRQELRKEQDAIKENREPTGAQCQRILDLEQEIAACERFAIKLAARS